MQQIENTETYQNVMWCVIILTWPESVSNLYKRMAGLFEPTLIFLGVTDGEIIIHETGLPVMHLNWIDLVNTTNNNNNKNQKTTAKIKKKYHKQTNVRKPIYFKMIYPRVVQTKRHREEYFVLDKQT